MQNKIKQLANYYREKGNYKFAAALCKISTDLALYEQKQEIVSDLQEKLANITSYKRKLKACHLHKQADQLDVIAKDLEAKLIAFSAEDPIQAVLTSYSLIHKIALNSQESNEAYQQLKLLADSDATDQEIINKAKTLLLGLPESDKREVLYLLEREFNLTIPFEKVANTIQEKLEIDLMSEEQKEKNKRKSKEVLDEAKKEQKKDEESESFRRSFESSPPMWSGFAYQAIVPYQQSSQINYWTLASSEDEILSKIAKIQK